MFLLFKPALRSHISQFLIHVHVPPPPPPHPPIPEKRLSYPEKQSHFFLNARYTILKTLYRNSEYALSPPVLAAVQKIRDARWDRWGGGGMFERESHHDTKGGGVSQVAVKWELDFPGFFSHL